MEKQLVAAGVPFTLVEAVDGQALDLDAIAAYPRRTRLRRYGIDLAPAEIGCYLSHCRILADAVEHGMPHTLVLEDDAVIPRNLGAVLAEIERLGQSFEIVRLAGTRVPPHLPLRRLDDHRLVRLLGTACNATAYVISQQGAARLLAATGTILRQFDVAIDRYWAHGARIFALLPYPVWPERSIASDIGARVDVWDLPGRGHWRLKTKYWKIGDSIGKRLKNVSIRLEHSRARPAA